MKRYVKTFQQFCESFEFNKPESHTEHFVIKYQYGENDPQEVATATNITDAEQLVTKYQIEYGDDCKVWFDIETYDADLYKAAVEKGINVLNSIPNAKTGKGYTYDLIPQIEQLYAEGSYKAAIKQIVYILNSVRNTHTKYGKTYDIASEFSDL